ncbi:CesT family type III secretion system chaperone [Actimicrobium antarcticum]|uniref:Tir chaperone protein (CesT) family protein n=1 Tax=Actimicrobium antarcticum TaxID=1051899 RepID=A0ABP7U232_9BURK
MATTFGELIEGFCRLKNLDYVTELAAGAPLSVDGTCCALIHNDMLDADVVFLYVEYAYAPLDRLSEIYQHLLRQNHLSFDGLGPGYCISPTTGKIVEVTRLALPELTPDRLASTLVVHADRCRRWRRINLPDDVETPVR